MSVLKIHKATAMPGSPEAHSIYCINPPGEDDYVEIYVTGALGTTIRRVLKETDVQALIDASLSAFTNLQVVADITARDALTPAGDMLVLVKDASADATVTSGAATYVYELSETAWSKIAEYESLDVTLDWADIANKPTSSAANIDNAVSLRHSHTNKTQLDKVAEDGDGNMTYDGDLPATPWAATGW